MAIQYDQIEVSQALPVILSDLLDYADEVGSRNGRVKELLNPQIALYQPWRREVICPGRGANIFAQIAETMWVLSGRNDVEWLSAYLPRAKDYSDDGETWRGGYGPRLRSWDSLPLGSRTAGQPGPIDQLRHVVDTLKNDSLSRRAVIAIYDPAVDTSPGKDIPCNDFLQFQNRGGKLYLTVTVRSNDVMWGWSGINAFEWSVLQEIVASLLRLSVGPLTFNIGSLHLYEMHWKKAREIVRLNTDCGVGITKELRFNTNKVITTLDDVDDLLASFFMWEERCRTGDVVPKNLDHMTSEPLFRAWMAAIAYYWTRHPAWLDEFSGTALAVAVARTPVSLLPEPVRASQAAPGHPSTPQALSEPHRAFYNFVTTLHAAKHASYGDSWKKRGEKLSILANIARKVDRLGVADRFEAESDTWIDLWVYLAKYLCWLTGNHQGPERVDSVLEHALLNPGSTHADLKEETTDITLLLDNFMNNIDNVTAEDKRKFVSEMIARVAPTARDIWIAENEYRGMDAQ